MNTAVLSFGSNVRDKEAILRAALSVLQCQIEEATEPYMDDHGYANIVAVISTESDFEELRRHTKNLETRFGRTPSSKAPADVALDIDIVIFNGKTIRPDDFNQPYFHYGYNQLKLQV